MFLNLVGLPNTVFCYNISIQKVETCVGISSIAFDLSTDSVSQNNLKIIISNNNNF